MKNVKGNGTNRTHCKIIKMANRRYKFFDAPASFRFRLDKWQYTEDAHFYNKIIMHFTLRER